MNPKPLCLIAAMDRHRLIGAHGRIPWSFPEDLKHFKTATLHHPVLMGRNTWESLGKPLPERDNLVLSKQALKLEGALCFTSLEEARRHAELYCSGPKIMVIGGAFLYAQTLHEAQSMLLTEIDAAFEGDTYFPQWNPEEWKSTVLKTFEKTADRPFKASIKQYTRK